MIVIWILLIVGVVFFVQWTAEQAKKTGNGSGNETALDILKKRYAKGEINKEEYEQKKKDLG
ncbi:MAG: SHOCT domain-containing protein [Candidatus Margulisiibacteriota bacterium]